MENCAKWVKPGPRLRGFWRGHWKLARGLIAERVGLPSPREKRARPPNFPGQSDRGYVAFCPWMTRQNSSSAKVANSTKKRNARIRTKKTTLLRESGGDRLATGGRRSTMIGVIDHSRGASRRRGGGISRRWPWLEPDYTERCSTLAGTYNDCCFSGKS